MAIKASKIIDKLKQMKGKKNVNPIKRVIESENLERQLTLDQLYNDAEAERKAKELARQAEIEAAAEDRADERAFLRSFPKRFGKGYSARTPRR